MTKKKVNKNLKIFVPVLSGPGWRVAIEKYQWLSLVSREGEISMGPIV